VEKESVGGESKSLFFGRCGFETGGRETRKNRLKKRKKVERVKNTFSQKETWSL
jgi:hypothetical protein